MNDVTGETRRTEFPQKVGRIRQTEIYLSGISENAGTQVNWQSDFTGSHDFYDRPARIEPRYENRGPHTCFAYIAGVSECLRATIATSIRMWIYVERGEMETVLNTSYSRPSWWSDRFVSARERLPMLSCVRTCVCESREMKIYHEVFIILEAMRLGGWVDQTLATGLLLFYRRLFMSTRTAVRT